MKQNSEGNLVSVPLVAAAFAAVYLIWGSTYLAIRLMVETVPPLLGAGLRFLMAGGVLYAYVRLRGGIRPRVADWGHATVVGGLMLAGGNGAVTWAEKSIPSNVAALMIAGTPFWMALFDWLRPGGQRPALRTLVGIGTGFFGMLLLVGSATPFDADHLTPSTGGGMAVVWGPMLVMVFACVAWSVGALYSRYVVLDGDPLRATALNMLTGGALLFALAVLRSEPANMQTPSATSLWAFAYLVIFGSLVGFTAYMWLLRVSTPARVSTSAYVNPLVAVVLGWGVLGEALAEGALSAAFLILFSVVLITLPTRHRGVKKPK